MDWGEYKNVFLHTMRGEFISAVRCAFRIQIVRYVFSGGIAAAVNIGTLYILVKFFELYYLFASGVAFALALLVSFTLHKVVTFQDSHVKRIPRQMILYLFLLGFNVCLNLFLMWVIVDSLKVMYLIAQIIVSGAIAVWSFFAYRHIVFKVLVSDISLQQTDIRE